MFVHFRMTTSCVQRFFICCPDTPMCHRYARAWPEESIEIGFTSFIPIPRSTEIGPMIFDWSMTMAIKAVSLPYSRSTAEQPIMHNQHPSNGLMTTGSPDKPVLL